MQHLRHIFESIVYAGMKPRDPFYLSNRTTGQRIRLAAWIAIPFVAVLGGVALASMGYFHSSSQLPPPAKPLSNAEIAARTLPDLKQDIPIETNRDLQVLDVFVGRGRISGSVKNATTRALGAVSCRFTQLAPGSSTPFLNPIPQTDAVYTVVREIHAQ